MQYKITNKEEKTTQGGKPYIRATLTDTNGKVFEKINAFEGEFNGADMWHGELEQKGNFYNLITPKKSTGGSAYMANKKSADIQEAQQRKEQGIAKAQDRSAWMWAKTNAADILSKSGHITAKMTAEDVANRVVRLATLIYNGEPTEPFSAPYRAPHVTSASPDHPEGIDAYNHPLTTDAERQAMDEEDAPPIDIRDMDLSDIPF